MTRHLENEFRGLFLGRKLGSGMSRKVYQCRQDCEAVVKIEIRGGMFQNIREWEAWSQLQYSPRGKWLAPCIAISPCGTILLQRKIIPLRMKEAPKKMPSFLNDFKLENYGIYNGRVVCCDYGTFIIAGGMRLKPANWSA